VRAERVEVIQEGGVILAKSFAVPLNTLLPGASPLLSRSIWNKIVVLLI
jgi:hypothetical protein